MPYYRESLSFFMNFSPYIITPSPLQQISSNRIRTLNSIFTGVFSVDILLQKLLNHIQFQSFVFAVFITSSDFNGSECWKSGFSVPNHRRFLFFSNEQNNHISLGTNFGGSWRLGRGGGGTTLCWTNTSIQNTF